MLFGQNKKDISNKDLDPDPIIQDRIHGFESGKNGTGITKLVQSLIGRLSVKVIMKKIHHIHHRKRYI